MRVALLSPYHGGSHRAWAEGLVRHSAHDLCLLSLPARFWKWRMHGSAITLARELEQLDNVEALLVTDMLDLTTLLALTRRSHARTPVMLYMHENQLTYPLPEAGEPGPMRRQAGERDRHYGFINLASMLVADRVVFNSEYHRRSVLEEAPRFLRHFPEHRETGAVDQIAARSHVVPIGIETGELRPSSGRGADVPLVIWSQRWEYDKNPAAFFTALSRMAEEGLAFRVALCGERFGREPSVFSAGIRQLGSRVIHTGFLPRGEYVRLLGRADIVVSTAHHEFFGIATLEATGSGALPLLPHRLSYPEIVPERFHDLCLYRDQAGLESRLRAALTGSEAPRDTAKPLAQAIRSRYDWGTVIGGYDRALEEMVTVRSALV